MGIWKKFFSTTPPSSMPTEPSGHVNIPVSDDPIDHTGSPFVDSQTGPEVEQTSESSHEIQLESSGDAINQRDEGGVPETSLESTQETFATEVVTSAIEEVDHQVVTASPTEESSSTEVSETHGETGEPIEKEVPHLEDSSEKNSEPSSQESNDLEPVEEPIDPEILAEEAEYSEDLSVLDGRILPELKVPNWREELEFVKERYEPCDLADHIVKVSKRRLTARRIEFELAQSRLTAYERYLERASRRFKDKIDEDALLNTALEDISQWRSDQAKSVAWVLADRINDEVLKARNAEKEATAFVEENVEFTNPSAIATYRKFARSFIVIPLVTAYVMSVIALTYTRFEWIIKFLPFFNLGLAKVQFMIAGISSYFVIRSLWRYSRAVAKIQRQLTIFNDKYQEQEARIRHAVSEHTRLSQQQPMVEPILNVLAKAYRVQLQSDISARAQVTTEFSAETLPACVSLARAVDDDEVKMARLKRRALKVLMSRGWRTNGLNDIARIHADSRMLDSHSLSLQSLDTDSVVSATSAQKMLIEAFSNTSIHNRVSRSRLIKAIQDLHQEVLANWSSQDRPKVLSLRDFGFDKIAFRTSWLADEDGTEDWLEFLREVLTEETAPFSAFNILNKRSTLNDRTLIQSVAVVPHYFELKDSSIQIAKSPTDEVMPLDVVVRVDVSPWADPSDFTVFANSTLVAEEEPNVITTPSGGFTSA